MARRILQIGVPAIAAYGIYQTNRLLTDYPIRPASSYHQCGSIIPLLPHSQSFDPIEVVYAHIPINHRADHSFDKRTKARLDQLLEAFWSTGTLRLEALACRLTSHSAPDDLLHTTDFNNARPDQESTAFAHTLFPIYRYYPSSVVFQWQFTPRVGGIQELAAVERDHGRLEISYACAQYGLAQESGSVFDRIAGGFHRMYMRFLIDRARRKLERLQQP